MVSSRLVDSPPPSPATEIEGLPPRMFAVGEEPVGIRVSGYHKSKGIRSILNALNPDEVEIIRNSSFGKFISLVDEPTLSGRFGRFMMSRQLKTKKKHELWFLFAGKPVRFSLREFAIATGLPCGKYPVKSKKRMRKNISETPYWPSLFGKLDVVPVLSVIKMLKKKTVTDRETRIKYACLALLASVLLPTTHQHKISKEHAELIKDLEQFFAYPWGRLSFDLLMKSIKERDEVSLSQGTISVPGFALSLQLVMTAAVPALTEVVQEHESSSSENDSDEEEEDVEPVKYTKRVTLSPAHARSLNKDSETEVFSIIPEDSENPIDVEALRWSDEEDDACVDKMVDLISQGHTFSNIMFTGGASKVDVNRMREEAKAKKAAEMEAKGKKTAKKGKAHVAPNMEVDSEQISAMVGDLIKGELRRFEDKVDYSIAKVADLKAAFIDIQTDIKEEFRRELRTAQFSIIHSVSQLSENNMSYAHVPSGSEAVRGHYPHDSRSAARKEIGLDRAGHIISQVIGSVSNQNIGSEDLRNQPSNQEMSGKDGNKADQIPPPVGQQSNQEMSGKDGNKADQIPPPVGRESGPVDENPTEIRSPFVSPVGFIGGRDVQEEVTPMEEEEEDASVNGSVNRSTGPAVGPEPVILKEATNEPGKGLPENDGGNSDGVILDGAVSLLVESTPHSCEINSNVTADSQKFVLLGKNLNEDASDNGGGTKEIPDSFDNVNEDCDGWIVSTTPSFSIGLTQEEVDPFLMPEAAAVNELWKSKRQKTVPHSLVGEFRCDTPIMQRAREAHMLAKNLTFPIDVTKKYEELLEKTKKKFTIKVGGISISNKDLLAITERSTPLTAKVIDALMHHTRALYSAPEHESMNKRVVFFDSKFVASLGKNFSKFSKAKDKEVHNFPKEVVRYFDGGSDNVPLFAQSYYFPFNLDKKHWVGICVDFQSATIVVLDCNNSLRNDSMMASELKPIAEMFPYLLKNAGRCVTSRDFSPLQVQRPRSVPQNANLAESAIASVLLLQSHAIGGLDFCRCITPDSIERESQRLAVLLHDAYQ